MSSSQQLAGAKSGRIVPERPRRSRYEKVGTSEGAADAEGVTQKDVEMGVETEHTETVPMEAVEEEYIQVKTVDDVVYKVPYRQDLTFSELRVEVERVSNVPVASQRLIFNGRILTDDSSTMNIPPGSCIHLVVTQPGQYGNHARRDSTSSTDSDIGVYGHHGLMPETLVQRQLSHLHGLAWVVVVVFTLFAWRMLMTLAFNDDPDQSPFAVNLARFILAIYGLAVGWYGVTLVSSHRTSTFQETKKKVFLYIVLLLLLAIGYLLSTLEAVNFDKDAFFGVFLIQSTFWYCIMQAQMTHRALVYASGNSSSAPAAPSAPLAPPRTGPVRVAPADPLNMYNNHWAFQDHSARQSSSTAAGVQQPIVTETNTQRPSVSDVEMQPVRVQPSDSPRDTVQIPLPTGSKLGQ